MEINAGKFYKLIFVLLAISSLLGCSNILGEDDSEDDSPTWESELLDGEDGNVFFALRGWTEAEHRDVHFEVAEFDVYPSFPDEVSYGYGGFYYTFTPSPTDRSDLYWFEEDHDLVESGDDWIDATTYSYDREGRFPGGMTIKISLTRGEAEEIELSDGSSRWDIAEGTAEFTHTKEVVVDGDTYIEFQMEDFN